MTPAEAKELTLEIWRYRTEHPEKGANLPDTVREKLADCDGYDFPLCFLYRKGPVCAGCPFEKRRCPMNIQNGLWAKWEDPKTKGVLRMEERKKAAAGMVKLAEGWDV